MGAENSCFFGGAIVQKGVSAYLGSSRCQKRGRAMLSGGDGGGGGAEGRGRAGAGALPKWAGQGAGLKRTGAMSLLVGDPLFMAS